MPKPFFTLRRGADLLDREGFDAQIYVLPVNPGCKNWTELRPKSWPKEDWKIIESLAKRLDVKPGPGKNLSFDRTPMQRWGVVLVDKEQDTFTLLGLARQILSPLKEHNCRKILADLSFLSADQAIQQLDVLISALKSLEFNPPRYQSEKKPAKDAYEASLEVVFADDVEIEKVKKIGKSAEMSAESGNLVRHLVMQAGNDLTPKKYVETLKKLAGAEGLSFAFYSQKKLTTMKAGAFLAVAQGAAQEDAGIVKLSYEPEKKKGVKHLCLVGKGITFDTGGTNLKSAAHMWGMHRDMAGSAVAYALIQLAAREKWPLRVTAFLAIAENATGAKAYRQNDVVTALNGKTIEIVHTDAEGRMVLADTLHLASEEKPDLIMDFATLTGACVAAISTLYSGVFTNRSDYHPALIEAGKTSGERVWPFPMDEDFSESLKSDTADIKQCRLTGGVDHIEAAMFLKEFINKEVPWVHVDLSAAENPRGLAHIDTETTGFGVRFGAAMVKKLFQF